jgi:hypothetical protein
MPIWKVTVVPPALDDVIEFTAGGTIEGVVTGAAVAKDHVGDETCPAALVATTDQ